MHILVTAGNTATPIDRVRCLTNVFTGRTGGTIAARAHARGHVVCLLTSHPDAAPAPAVSPTWRVDTYRTFEDLESLLERELRMHRFDAVIHAAAVNDYLLAGAYVADAEAHFEPSAKIWSSSAGTVRLIDAHAPKIPSRHGELWLRLVPAPKLVDRFRQPWGFHGRLVKFKLEADVSDPELLEIAEASRLQSQADWMVANTLEGMANWAYLGPIEGTYRKVERAQLADRILDLLEKA